ncbi:FGGY family carbohydrate kinase [Caldibacillus thermoamylovorans]|mgnify:CR=1 FL=1|uniref:FGGY family carbohydrate kinase n=1 Tax=Caldibacillus thermoamylovorans TaxID=35841 RepID=UPI001374A00C|nr:FGGY family carbohydrate kinase [Caldibacillus thermoamylovorans]
MAKNERHFISIDVGTTNLKISVFSSEYVFLDKHHYSYTNIVVDECRYELDFAEIWQAIRDGIEELIVRNRIVQADIILTTAMHSVQLLEEDFRLTGPLLVWSDKRGAEFVQQSSMRSLERRYRISGTPNHSMNPFYKLKSLQNDLDGKRIGSLKDVIFYQLTGKWATDRASAASSGLYDLSSHRWSEALLAELNVDSRQLPEIKKPDFCLNVREHLFPILKEGKVYIGTTDGVSSNYAFSTLERTAVLSIGTSHAVRVVTDKPCLNFETQNFCYEITDGKYLVGYPSNNGGNVLAWILEAFQMDWDELNVLLKVQPATTGVFLPFINGERAPVWNDSLKAQLVHLDRRVNRKSLIYTMVCGVIFNIKHNVDNLSQLFPFERIGLVGGVTKSKEMCQLIADILGYEVFVPKTPQAETLGSLALVKGIKGETDFTTYTPKQSFTKEYEQYLQVFQQYIK